MGIDGTPTTLPVRVLTHSTHVDVPDDEHTVVPRFPLNRNGRALVSDPALRKSLRQLAVPHPEALNAAIVLIRDALDETFRDAASKKVAPDPANVELAGALEHLLTLVDHHTTEPVLSTDVRFS